MRRACLPSGPGSPARRLRPSHIGSVASAFSVSLLRTPWPRTAIRDRNPVFGRPNRCVQYILHFCSLPQGRQRRIALARLTPDQGRQIGEMAARAVIAPVRHRLERPDLAADAAERDAAIDLPGLQSLIE